ncbi:hypothetical protein [Mycobacterium sp. AZCC_0083]|uniref:DUF7218 family protein n=1 Tax=Mycobacterium sp. AZCC_0083 TaxID=2735882 RepID=UPI00161469EA|nr:hypothetical protein [Mycobacterium sp. AZCC_0083]MBB5167514.1 hypothetical protein [Mycobacterium sp. AZCC_0083]
MTKDHGSSVKKDKQYEGLRKKGMSKSRAAAISNSPDASSRGGKSSGSSQSSKSSGSGSGGDTAQKKAAGRKVARNRASRSRLCDAAGLRSATSVGPANRFLHAPAGTVARSA